MSRFSFAPKIWTSKTLKNLIERAQSVCSNYDLLDEELKHLKTVFNEKKNYPKWTICQIKNQVKIYYTRKKDSDSININNPTPWKKTKKIVNLSFFPPIVARKQLVKSLQKNFKHLPNDKNTQVTYTFQY